MKFLPVVLSATSLFVSVPALVVAHDVQISGNVAAMFHLEPDHNPKAGQPSYVWFALTRKGGQIVPLSQCNCQLSVYTLPRRAGDTPLMQPALKSIDAENYRETPGADIVFPKAGAYQLELKGTPRNGANFQPFQFTYTVNVRR
jgi:hypothetical protein